MCSKSHLRKHSPYFICLLELIVPFHSGVMLVSAKCLLPNVILCHDCALWQEWAGPTVPFLQTGGDEKCQRRHAPAMGEGMGRGEVGWLRGRQGCVESTPVSRPTAPPPPIHHQRPALPSSPPRLSLASAFQPSYLCRRVTLPLRMKTA